ncbi:MAG: ATP synthase F1 subunit epsilon [Roseivirga sp.]
MDAKTIQLTIITPDKTLFEGPVQRVTLPGSAGSFQVLANHAPLVSTLQQGAVLYKKGQQEHTLVIEEGLVEVLNNRVTVLLASTTSD